MKDKKTVSSIIAISLLLVVVVVIIIGFQSWFQTYSSSLFVEVEQGSSAGKLDTCIETIIGSVLYFNCGYSNITITGVTVDGFDCNVSGSYNNSISSINLLNCTGESTTTSPEVVVYTDKGIFSKTFYVESATASLDEEESVPSPPSANITDTFISVWTTNNTGATSNDDQIMLPLESDGTYNFLVEWGDGENDTITTWNQTDITHTYSSIGTYEVNITGEIKGFRFNNGGDDRKIVEIKQWGPLNVGNHGEYFEGCTNLDVSAADNLNLTGTTNLNFMFAYNSNFNGSIGNWNVSEVESMFCTFIAAVDFNQDISGWDVSSVTDMMMMFANSNFNQDISSWDVSSVESMYETFAYNAVFNQPLNDWDMSSVSDTGSMFSASTSFNQNLSSWDISNVAYMSSMFSGATNFNSNITNWNVSNALKMNDMFRDAVAFNQDISGWNVGNVTDMDDMFRFTDNFNQDISGWDVSSVIDMGYMFNDAIAFNQDLSSWDVDQVTACSQFNVSTPVWVLDKPNFVSCSP